MTHNNQTEPFFISVTVLILAEMAVIVIISIKIMAPMFVLGIIRVLEIISFMLIYVMWGNSLASLGLARHQIVPGLKRGLIWSSGFGIIVTLAFGILFLSGRNPFNLLNARLPEQPGELLFFLLLRGVIGPVAEEIFFRGILYGFLRRWGVFIALFLSSLMFVLVHPVSGPTQMVGSILFAVAYETEGKLMVPITIHALGNMAIFAVSALHL